MKRVQVSILAIILVVATCAMAFTALRTASKLWYSALYTFAAFVLLFAVLAARFRRGPERAFWFGFAVFGWAFFLMGLGPWIYPFAQPRSPMGRSPAGRSLNPNLLTSRMIVFLVPYLRKDANDLGAIDEITENTIGIAHLLTTLILASVGGIIAALLRRRPRRGTSVKSLAILAGLGLITAVAASIGPARYRDPFFPDTAFATDKDGDDSIVKWYSEHLDAMGEHSLLTLSRKDRDAIAYRLLWLPTFDHPVCVRIDKTGEGARLLARVLDGQGGYDPGQVAIVRHMTMAGDRWDELERLLQEAAFWDLPTEQRDSMGCDGDQLIVEGVKGGAYHVVDRSEGDPTYEALCHYMLVLTNIEMRAAWEGYHPSEPSAEPEGGGSFIPRR